MMVQYGSVAGLLQIQKEKQEKYRDFPIKMGIMTPKKGWFIDEHDQTRWPGLEFGPVPRFRAKSSFDQKKRLWIYLYVIPNCS